MTIQSKKYGCLGSFSLCSPIRTGLDDRQLFSHSAPHTAHLHTQREKVSMSMSGHPVFHSIEWRPICVLSLFIRRNCDLHTTAKHPVCVVHKHTCVRLFTGHTGLIRFSSCRHRCCGSGFGPASWLLHCKNRTHTHTHLYNRKCRFNLRL